MSIPANIFELLEDENDTEVKKPATSAPQTQKQKPASSGNQQQKKAAEPAKSTLFSNMKEINFILSWRC